MATKTGLIASAGNLADLEQLISRYLYGRKVHVCGKDVCRDNGNGGAGDRIDGFEVVFKGNRYRFQLDAATMNERSGAFTA